MQPELRRWMTVCARRLTEAALPPVVYRASPPEHDQRAPSAPHGVWISTDPAQAGQFHDRLVAYPVIHQPKILNLNDWLQGRTFVARERGIPVGAISKLDYDDEVVQVFVEGAGAARLRRMGYDGMQYGDDIFLLGDLGVWVGPGTVVNNANR